MADVKAFLATVSEWHDIEAEQAGSTLTVNTEAVAANWRTLRRAAGSADCSAVIKANAYGLGLEPVALALTGAGCRTFFVAHIFEGQQLRALLPEAIIYVLNGLMPRTASLFIKAGLRPVLGSIPELEDWIEATSRVRAPCAIQIDSGMNRLGLIADQVPRASRLSARIDISLVLSHFVWSGQGEQSRNVERQIALFDAARRAWSGIPASMANSSGIFYGGGATYDLVRPGYALYGGNPTPDIPNPMQAVVGFEAKVIQVHEVAAGESVGYDAHWVAPSRRRLATISVGYADGIPCSAIGTNAEPRGHVSVDGALCPMVGRISMDLIVIDVSDAPLVERGDTVEIVGSDISIDDLARHAGTIGYEILTRLGQRSHRRTVGRRSPVLHSAA